MARDPLLLVHLPKTAGTTLAQLMRYHYRDGAFKGAGNVFSRPEQVERRLDAIGRKARYRAAAGHVSFGLAARMLPGATFVTILREPVARTLSHYFFLNEHRRGAGLVPPWLEDEPGDLSLQDAFERGYLLDDLQTRLLCGLVSPYDPLPDDALERAKQNLAERFAWVGTTERFDQLLALLNLALGWPTTAYERARANPRPRAEVPAGLRVLAAEHNRLDRELHAYAGHLLDRAVASTGPEVADEVAVIEEAVARWNGTEAQSKAVRSEPLDERVELALEEAELVRAAFQLRNRRAKVKRRRRE